MSDDLVPASRCPWCSAAAPVGASSCPDCGAALAQRESIAGLQITGVTSVDPALLDADGRPMHIPKSSPTQGMAGGVMLAALAGGPVGLAAIGGLAVVGAAEYALSGRGGRDGAPSLDDLGRPSEAALRAIERLSAENAADGADPSGSPQEPPPERRANDPWRDLPDPGAPSRRDW
jgi:hypothetical protein